jgi:hypothetical protein
MGTSIAMQIIPVIVEGAGTAHIVYALLDQCSNVSLCTEAFLSMIRAKGKESTIKISTVSGMLNTAVREVGLTVHGIAPAIASI